MSSAWKNGDPRRPPTGEVLQEMIEDSWPTSAIYGWTSSKKGSADADAAAQLHRDSAKAEWDDGRRRWNIVTPYARMVKVARDPGHPAHKLFEWSDAAAARQQRLDRAAYLSRNLVVLEVTVTVNRTPPVRRRTQYNVTVRKPNGRASRSQVAVVDMLAEGEYRKQVVDGLMDRIIRNAAILEDHAGHFPWIKPLVRAVRVAERAAGI